MAQKEIPCYLFVGMLESGKTKFHSGNNGGPAV